MKTIIASFFSIILKYFCIDYLGALPYPTVAFLAWVVSETFVIAKTRLKNILAVLMNNKGVIH